MLPFFQLIRFPNLIIIVLTQFLLQYCVLIPALKQDQLSPSLDHLHFALLVFTTLLIATGGYIINDLKDIDIDRINKPDKMIIGKIYSEKKGYQLYHSMNAIGMLLSIYLALHVNNLLLASLFPSAVFLLWLYSSQLKKSLLLGNLLVAVFCAFVAGIIWFAERYTYGQASLASQQEIRWIFGAYMLFAAISTLYREIIKDIEDQEGDRKLGGKTLPILYGLSIAKKVAAVCGVLLLGLLLYWCQSLMQEGNYPGLIYGIAGIILPLLYSFFLLYQAKKSQDFRQLSRLAKYLMFSGILYLVFYGIF